MAGRRTIAQHLQELERRGGLRFDLENWEPKEKNPLNTDADVSIRNATPMSILAALCASNKLPFSQGGESGEMRLGSARWRQVWALGQRNLVVLHEYGGMKKWVDLAGPFEWTSYLCFDVLMGPGTHVSKWKDVRVVEALSEKGDDLRRNPAAEGPRMLDFDDGPQRDNSGYENGFSVRLRLPAGVRTAARLKMTAVAEIFTKHRTAEATLKDGEGRGAADNGGLEIEIKQVGEPRSMYAEFTLRVKAPDVTGRDLSERRMRIEATCSGRPGIVELTLKEVGAKEVVYEGVWKPGIEYRVADEDEAILEKVKVFLGDGLGERQIFAEFRDIPLR